MKKSELQKIANRIVEREFQWMPEEVERRVGDHLDQLYSDLSSKDKGMIYRFVFDAMRERGGI